MWVLRSLFVLSVAMAACTGAIDGESPSPASPDPGPRPVNPPAGGRAGGTGGAGAAPSATGGTMGAPQPVPPLILPPGPPAPASRFARLSHKQWEATVKDLLRLPAAPNLASAFIAEPSRASFDNNGGLLQVQPPLWLDYQHAAETLAERVATVPASLAKLVPANAPAAGDARARAFIEAFGLRAYRRPLSATEVQQYLGLFKQGTALVGGTDPFADGAQLVIALFLQSPHFLYRVEIGGPAKDGRVPLTDHEIASRLSYGLTGSMPDDALFAAAAGNQLTAPAAVREQAKRLLVTPLAQGTIDEFHRQLLDLDRYELISKDKAKFPEYASAMNRDMARETLEFVRDVIVKRGLGLTEILTAPYTIANGALAAIYGAAPPVAAKPTDWGRVELDPTQRAGLLTHSGFLASHADSREPNAILRGAFVALELLCVPMPPPPDAAGALPALKPNQTNRERVTAHTGPGTCGAGCHAGFINPAGFAFESFDALGKWRAMDADRPVDASGTFAFDDSPRTFSGAVEFARALASSAQAHACYARNWLEYVYGREADAERDGSLLAALGSRSAAGGGVKDLLLDLVTTDAFLTRAP